MIGRAKKQKIGTKTCDANGHLQCFVKDIGAPDQR
jgi:hypothetical protein